MNTSMSATMPLGLDDMTCLHCHEEYTTHPWWTNPYFCDPECAQTVDDGSLSAWVGRTQEALSACWQTLGTQAGDTDPEALRQLTYAIELTGRLAIQIDNESCA